ncbi:MAG: YitT family protein [Comamonas sp.]
MSDPSSHAAAPATPPLPPPHSLWEDMLAIATGVLMVSIGVAFFKHEGLLTGGMAGLAFSLFYLSDIGFGVWFFALNLPFYWLAIRKMGWDFTLKTFAAVGLLSLVTELQPLVFQIGQLHAGYAAIVGGVAMGVGMLILFRHRCSLGGLGILALYLQDRYGWRSGHILMGFDVVILLGGFFILPLDKAVWSILAAFTLNQLLSVNHRPGRYTGLGPR